MLAHHAYNSPEGWDSEKYGPGILDVYKLISAPLPDVQDLQSLPPPPGRPHEGDMAYNAI